MSAWDWLLRRTVRVFLRRAERRIARAGELGTPLASAPDVAPVLLVHGYGNDSRSMRAIARSLDRDGFRVSTIDLPDVGFGDVLEDAVLVRTRVRSIAAECGADSVDVIGHSRGGIVARAAMQLADERDDAGIRRVVTIASGNQGIHLGWIQRRLDRAILAHMRPLLRGAELLARLGATADEFDLVAVGTSRTDGMLIPAKAARIPGAPFHVVDDGRTLGPMSRIGHWRILRDDHAYELIRGALLAPRARA